MRAPCSRELHPAAPVLPISLAVMDESPRTGPHLSLVDTGADGTFVPVALLEELSVPMVYLITVRSHLGERSQQVAVHRVDIVFDSIRLPGIDVVSDDWGDQIILGRNVLNRLHIMLEGSAGVTTVD